MKINKYYGSLLVAIITALGYFCAYRYETGYLEYFGLPSVLMDLSVPVITSSIIAVLMISFIIMFTISQFRSTENKQQISMREKIMKWGGFTFLLGFMVYLFGYDTKGILSILTLLILAFFACDSTIFQDNSKTFSGKDCEASNQDESARQNASKHLGFNKEKSTKMIILLSILSYIVYIFANYVGVANAKRETMFYVIESEKPYVVLRAYNNKFIVAPIDKQKRWFKPKYSIIKPESNSINDAIVFTRENIGPITIEDIK